MRRIAGVKQKRQEPWVPRFLFFIKSYHTIHTSSDFLQSTQLLLTLLTHPHSNLPVGVDIKDIDETVKFSTGYKRFIGNRQVGFGSSFWFAGVAAKVSGNPAGFVALLRYYFATQKHLNQVRTEECVPDAIKMLQEKNIPVLGLTARSAPIADITIQKLEQLGIRFTSCSDEKIILDVPKKSNELDAIYYKGIIFCSGQPKDQCFEAFLKTPLGAKIFANVKRVSYTDDQRKYCDSMHACLQRHGFFPIVTHYTHVEEKIPRATESEILEDMRQLEKDHGIRPGW